MQCPVGLMRLSDLAQPLQGTSHISVQLRSCIHFTSKHINSNWFDSLSKCGVNLGKPLPWIGVDVVLVTVWIKQVSHGIMRGLSCASCLCCQLYVLSSPHALNWAGRACFQGYTMSPHEPLAWTLCISTLFTSKILCVNSPLGSRIILECIRLKMREAGSVS